MDSILTAPPASPTVISPEIVLQATSCAPAEQWMSAVIVDDADIRAERRGDPQAQLGLAADKTQLARPFRCVHDDLGLAARVAKLLLGGVDGGLGDVTGGDRCQFDGGGVAFLQLDLDRAGRDPQVEPGAVGVG